MKIKESAENYLETILMLKKKKYFIFFVKNFLSVGIEKGLKNHSKNDIIFIIT